MARLREHLATYVPAAAPNSATRAANSSGERQLDLLSGHLRAIDALIPITAYKMNRQLRTGIRQEVDDWLTCIVGYESYDEVLADVHAAFATLGNAARLDEPVQAFRGASDDTHPILALAPGTTFRDDGYLFATPDRDVALYYAGKHVEWGPRGTRPIVMNLRLHSALYLPDPQQRTPSLVESVDGFGFLKDANAQFIVPAGSQWRLDSVNAPGGSDVVEVTCTQL